MTLNEMIAEVYTLTNRPDLVAQTLTAVRSATLKAHQQDYFYKDIIEQAVIFSSAQFLQQLEYRTLIPTWRALKYLRKTDFTGGQEGPFFEVLSVPEMIEDDYRLNRNDVCYVAGSVIQIRSSTLLQYLLLGCYVNPNVTPTGFNSWMAIDHPYAVVFEAASYVFKMIGDTEQFAAYTALAAMQMNEVKLTNIQGIGY